MTIFLFGPSVIRQVPTPTADPIARTTSGPRPFPDYQTPWEANMLCRRSGALMQHFDTTSVDLSIALGGGTTRISRAQMESQGTAINRMINAGTRFLIHPGVYRQDNGQMPNTPAQLISTVKKYGPSNFVGVASVNEPNAPVKIVNATTYWQWLRDYQEDLWNAFKNDPVVRDVPILTPSIRVVDISLFRNLGNIDQWVDGHESHTYPFDAHPPEKPAIFDSVIESFRVASSQKPVHYGEFGYHTDQAEWSVDAIVYKDRFMPRMYLYFFDHGFSSLVNYRHTSTLSGTTWNSSDSEEAYGWVKATGQVQASYTSCKNLFTLLADPGVRHTTTPLAYTISGQTTNVQHVLMQKRNGVYYLAVWVGTYQNENRNVVINLPSSITTARKARPNTNTSWANQTISGNSISFSADGYVTLFEVQ